MDGADEAALLNLLRRRVRIADPLVVPLVVPHLAHKSSDPIRQMAKRRGP